jgi:hypothetical protein
MVRGLFEIFSRQSSSEGTAEGGNGVVPGSNAQVKNQQAETPRTKADILDSSGKLSGSAKFEDAEDGMQSVKAEGASPTSATSATTQAGTSAGGPSPNNHSPGNEKQCRGSYQIPDLPDKMEGPITEDASSIIEQFNSAVYSCDDSRFRKRIPVTCRHWLSGRCNVIHCRFLHESVPDRNERKNQGSAVSTADGGGHFGPTSFPHPPCNANVLGSMYGTQTGVAPHLPLPGIANGITPELGGIPDVGLVHASNHGVPSGSAFPANNIPHVNQTHGQVGGANARWSMPSSGQTHSNSSNGVPSQIHVSNNSF